MNGSSQILCSDPVIAWGSSTPNIFQLQRSSNLVTLQTNVRTGWSLEFCFERLRRIVSPSSSPPPVASSDSFSPWTRGSSRLPDNSPWTKRVSCSGQHETLMHPQSILRRVHASARFQTRPLVHLHPESVSKSTPDTPDSQHPLPTRSLPICRAHLFDQPFPVALRPSTPPRRRTAPHLPSGSSPPGRAALGPWVCDRSSGGHEPCPRFGLDVHFQGRRKIKETIVD